MTKTNILILHFFINPSLLKFNETVFSSFVCTKGRVKRKMIESWAEKRGGVLRHRYRESTYNNIGFISLSLPLVKNSFSASGLG